MKLKLKVVFVLNFIAGASQIIGQDNKNLSTHSLFLQADADYHVSPVDNENFIIQNKTALQQVQDELNLIPFDHCKNSSIIMGFNFDENNNLAEVNIYRGTGIPATDSLFTQFATRKIPTSGFTFNNTSGIKKKFIIEFLFSLYTRSTRTNRTEQDIMYYHVTTVTIRGISRNDCEQDDYFYNQGVIYLKSGDYKRAIYHFKQAISYNEYDLDAGYNLAVSYFKSKNPEKACSCLKDVANKGDPESKLLFAEKCR